MREDVKVFDFFIVILIMIFILPLIYTIVLGTYLAAVLGLTGFVWWSFIILFTISLYALMGYLIHWSIS